MHTTIKYVAGDKMTNASLRARFGIEEHNAAQVSRVIKEAIEGGLIKPADPESPRAGYVPFWA